MFQVWEKYMQFAAQNEKSHGLGACIAGIPRFVVPGVGASQFALINNNHKYVYTDINSAYADCVSGQGDAIILLPGAHTLTANIAVAKNNVSFMGYEAWLGSLGARGVIPSASITPAAATDGFTITGTGINFIGLTCIPITAKNFATFNGATGLIVQNCFIDLATPAVNVATTGFKQAGATTDIRLSGCVAYCGGAQGPVLDATGCTRVLVELSDFFVSAGTWAAAMKTGAGTLAMRVRGCMFGGAGTAMTGIVGTAAEATNAVELLDNRCGVGHTLASGYGGANGKCVLDENFIATISGGTGGTLITVST